MRTDVQRMLAGARSQMGLAWLVPTVAGLLRPLSHGLARASSLFLLSRHFQRRLKIWTDLCAAVLGSPANWRR